MLTIQKSQKIKKNLVITDIFRTFADYYCVLNGMKKLFLCFLFVAFAATSAFAQRSEAGAFMGGSFYLGDLNSALFSQTQIAVGAVYRYNLTTRWALRGNVLWGTVTADDAKHNNPRNLNFRSRIGEFSVQAEINFMTYFTGSRRYRFTPYLFGGVGLFTFNPQGYYFDPISLSSSWIPLRELRTEGQGLIEYPNVKEYNIVQVALPFGLGFKYSLNNTFSIGLEWGMRFTFTDYLDDVSGFYADPNILGREFGSRSAYMSNRWNGPADERPPVGSRRGESNARDWYSFAGVTLTAKIGRIRPQMCPAHRVSGADRVRRAMGDF